MYPLVLWILSAIQESCEFYHNFRCYFIVKSFLSDFVFLFRIVWFCFPRDVVG